MMACAVFFSKFSDPIRMYYCRVQSTYDLSAEHDSCVFPDGRLSPPESSHSTNLQYLNYLDPEVFSPLLNSATD